MSDPEPLRAPWAPPTPYAPYGDDARDRVYDLLFADDAEAFRATGVAFEPVAGAESLTKLALDDGAESRIRALALRSLRSLGALPAAALPLLGVVVEVGLDGGLDVLAAYADGRARYLNHAGPMSLIEGGTVAATEIAAVLGAARPVAAAIGPWTGVRRPPPGRGIARLSFLVGDELEFGEAPIEVLARDRLAGPLFAAAARLLAVLAGLAAKR
jgi:hypothetical protein